MKLKVAESAGFCWGVKRAMDIVLRSANKKRGSIYTWGPLIHNQQVIQNLREKDIHPVEQLEKVSGNIILIRAHGVTPEVKQSLHDSAAEVIDATCPHVKKVQEIIAQHTQIGFSIVIIGDPGHAESIGLLGYTQGKGYLVHQREDIEHLPHLEKVCVVAQTTQPQERFEQLSKEIHSRVKECKIFNTICNATRQRQEETIKLAQETDLLVVVGDQHSANTSRLVELAREMGTKTILVETEDTLRETDFANCNLIGLTAGASTPTWLINRVVEKIHLMGEKPGALIANRFKKTLLLVIQANLYLALGAAALTYTGSRLQGIPFNWSYPIIAALFVLSMQILNRLLDQSLEILKSRGLISLSSWSYAPLLALGLISGISALVIAWLLGLEPFLILLVASVGGAIYSMQIVPPKWTRYLGLRRIRDIPASKEIVAALGWSIITAVLPWLTAGHRISTINLLVFAFVFLLVLVRFTIVSVRDVRRDRIMGREIILKVLGKSGTKVLIASLILLLAIVLGSLSLLLTTPLLGWIQFGVILYILTYYGLYYRGILSEGIAFELIIDAQFLLTALLIIIL